MEGSKKNINSEVQAPTLTSTFKGTVVAIIENDTMSKQFNTKT